MYQFQHFFRFAIQVSTQCFILIATKLTYNTVNHSRTKYVAFASIRQRLRNYPVIELKLSVYLHSLSDGCSHLHTFSLQYPTHSLSQNHDDRQQPILQAVDTNLPSHPESAFPPFASDWYQNGFRFPMGLPKYTYQFWRPTPKVHVPIQNDYDLPSKHS